MKILIGALVLSVICIDPALPYDNGAQTIGCDYNLGKVEGTDKCLIVGSGMNQGITWIVFEVQRKRFRYESSSPNIIVLINKSGDTITKHHVSNSQGQCRPGGRYADRYFFENGDRICLYWQ